MYRTAQAMTSFGIGTTEGFGVLLQDVVDRLCYCGTGGEQPVGFSK